MTEQTQNLQFDYAACDGYRETKNYTEDEARKALKGHELGGFYAVSFDGISTLTPANDAASELYASLRRAMQ